MTKRLPLTDHLEQLILDYSSHPDEPLTSADWHHLARAAKELAAARKIHAPLKQDKGTPSAHGLSKKTLQRIEHDILGIKR